MLFLVVLSHAYGQDPDLPYGLITEGEGVFSTYATKDWTEGSAKSVTIGIEQENAVKNVDIILEGGRTYNVILETRNACGDTDHHVIQFTARDCVTIKESEEVEVIDIDGVEVYPNPFGSNTVVTYDLLEPGDVEIYYYSLGSGGTGGKPVLKPADSGYKVVGEHTVSFTDTEMGEGVNYIVIYAGGQIYVKQAIKN